ncbi:hypothetical protein COCC4DRAFT_150564 [Bipolaris maydis ATCC 48331]|uniref:Uncharacterized protein n=2 Tax=Cochliobolus heterostrophus TaxID=5016 RepID=M2SHC4_COCH5|nr:uncharacterized protein COCC4DRAFT_150564 [Bipolaris maydis ATCC 48331]EMD84785.1 hypothetical protein COCHEDRAFT_1161887 [Bipolaris maydis C5]EMD95318.1 hypothetical protein COCHEDRAFT_1153123 [Bipolaris maydis C5]ENI00465.1 hypothetical protein COCC4DRAFT_150564 [Bipolaris maydis ATCC 48331]KAJ6214318.1 hypothetical protein PSV09DRAFT_1153123 [Bipolaris maydis]
MLSSCLQNCNLAELVEYGQRGARVARTTQPCGNPTWYEAIQIPPNPFEEISSKVIVWNRSPVVIELA